MYATLDHLKTLCGDRELIQLTDRADPPSGEMDIAVVTAALVAAASEIDGYVAAQYAVPLGTIPPLLVNLATDIARYRLHRNPTDLVRQRYEDAVKTLTNISRGVIKLPVEGGSGSAGGEPEGRDDVMVIQSEDRIFSRSTMRGL